MTKSGYHRNVNRLFPRMDVEQSAEARLAHLAERWNPLVGTKARHELREDVNSLIIDEVHRIQRFLHIKPSDTDRVKNLSELISRKNVFPAIQRKAEFLEYIQLYVVKVLHVRRAASFRKVRL